jgi:hypothetical protein
MKIGSLYQYSSTRRIELFENPENSNSFIVDFLGLLSPKEPFVLLEIISLEDIFWRLRILTIDGKVGWITIQFVSLLQEAKK